jgi:hypothetical protein
MSKVYSFRLSGDNPREAQAWEVIDAWVSQEHSLRHIITDALIGYQDKGDKSKEWNKAYYQLSELALGLENGVVDKEPIDDNPTLSPYIIDAMIKAAREGLVSN